MVFSVISFFLQWLINLYWGITNSALWLVISNQVTFLLGSHTSLFLSCFLNKRACQSLEMQLTLSHLYLKSFICPPFLPALGYHGKQLSMDTEILLACHTSDSWFLKLWRFVKTLYQPLLYLSTALGRHRITVSEKYSHSMYMELTLSRHYAGINCSPRYHGPMS